MTLLDDHQARYKLQGARLVSQLLYVTPADLLRRTGIDTLLLTVSITAPFSPTQLNTVIIVHSR